MLSALETAGVPIHSRVVLYAGQFDDNAYAVPRWTAGPRRCSLRSRT